MNELEKDIRNLITYISINDFDKRMHDILYYLKNADSLYIKGISMDSNELYLIKSQPISNILADYVAAYIAWTEHTVIIPYIEIKCVYDGNHIYEFSLYQANGSANVRVPEIEVCNFIDIFHNKLQDRYNNRIPEYFTPIKG